jgi:hypothetical protein|uniref:Uncharacterized protein n=1 Tax=viral metagenome TaxID=1070528 RepID=A0A6C0HDC1_9ZZZZ
MIFRKRDGSLIEIKRLDFKNDLLYYQKIMDLMMEEKTEKNEPNVLNSLNYAKVEKDEFVNAKIGNINRLLQKL